MREPKARRLVVIDDVTLQITPADGWSVVFTGRVEPVICWRLARITRQWCDEHVTGEPHSPSIYFRSGKKVVTTEILATIRTTLAHSREPLMRPPTGRNEPHMTMENLNVEVLPGFVGYFHASELNDSDVSGQAEGPQ